MELSIVDYCKWEYLFWNFSAAFLSKSRHVRGCHWRVSEPFARQVASISGRLSWLAIPGHLCRGLALMDFQYFQGRLVAYWFLLCMSTVTFSTRNTARVLKFTQRNAHSHPNLETCGFSLWSKLKWRTPVSLACSFTRLHLKTVSSVLSKISLEAERMLTWLRSPISTFFVDLAPWLPTLSWFKPVCTFSIFQHFSSGHDICPYCCQLRLKEAWPLAASINWIECLHLMRCSEAKWESLVWFAQDADQTWTLGRNVLTTCLLCWQGLHIEGPWV